MNVLLIGEHAAAARVLQSLAESGARIAAVMSSPPARHGPGLGLWSLASKFGYRTWPAELVKDSSFAAQVRDAGVDMIINVHSLFLIRKEVLEAPRLGSFNLHPSPLPRYAGLNPVSWAIYRGEKKHGVTLHKMAPDIDAGPVVYQEAVGIESEDTGLSLTAKCASAGVPLVLRLLGAAAQGPSNIPLSPQDLTKREYFGRDAPANGNLCWRWPARRIVDFVRASDFFPFPSPWGAPRTKLADATLGIAKAQLTGTPADAPPGMIGIERAGGVEVACADEWILVRQVFRGGKYVPAKEALKAGDRLRDCAITPASQIYCPPQQETRGSNFRLEPSSRDDLRQP
jgi:methionyl-tRNA formyltransferase